jgi:hypothetical protein
MEELVTLGAKHARGWLLSHRRAARLPELLTGDQLATNSAQLAHDAFLAIYYHQQPLRHGDDPKAHIISVINSIAANRLRLMDNWHRAREVNPAVIAARQAELAGHANVDGEQTQSAGGERSQSDRTHQQRLAAELKATLPPDRIFEASLVDAIGIHGLSDRRKLAKALKTSIEDVRKGLNWLLDHVKLCKPSLAEAIAETAADAVPANTIIGNVVAKRERAPP